jgi:hypothetical protein
MDDLKPQRRRRASTFRQRDVTRAIKAVVGAGVPVARVEVDKDGKIAIVAGHPGSGSGPVANDLDTWLAKHADAA